jgi:hypothetical protein
MSNETTLHSEVTDVVSHAYLKPAIAHELKLETRAGSPLSVEPLANPLSLNLGELQ